MAQSGSKSKQIIALTLANGINFVINFISTPYLARRLSYEDNGTLGQVNLINSYVVLVFGLGIGSVINLLLTENKGNERKVFSTNFWIFLISSIFATALLAIVSFYTTSIFNNSQLGYYLLLFLPSTFFLVLSSTFNNYLIFLNKTRALSVITVVFNTLKIILLYLSVNIFHSLAVLIVTLNIVNVATVITQFVVLKDKAHISKSLDLKYAKYIIKLSYPYLILGLLGYGIVYMDGIIISHMLPVKDYAIYRNGAMEIPFISTIYVSISTVVMPTVIKLSIEKRIDELFQLKRKISTTIASITFPIVVFLIINAHGFIELYLGPKYIESAIIFSIYNIAALIRINDYQDLLTANKQPRVITSINVIIFIFNIVANIIAIKIAGITGSAIAYIGSIVLLAILLMKRTVKLYDKNVIDYFDVKALGLIVLTSCILSLVIYTLNIKEIKLFITFFGCYLLIIYFTIIKVYKYIDVQFLPTKVKKIFFLIENEKALTETAIK